MALRFEKVVDLGRPQACAWVDIDDGASLVLLERGGEVRENVIFPSVSVGMLHVVGGSLLLKSPTAQLFAHNILSF